MNNEHPGYFLAGPAGHHTDSHTLLRVVPIVQTLPIDGGEFQFISLDVYTESCLLRYTLRHETAASAPAEAPTETGASEQDRWPPDVKPILVITDDLGTQYEGSGGASSGSDGFHSLSHNIWGPLNPNARALHIEVTRLLWRRYARPNHATKSRPTYINSIQEGPWRLTIPL